MSDVTIGSCRAHVRSHALLHSISALAFAAGAAITLAWSASMGAMDGMPMPGGWTMSMAWMRMPDQAWAGAAASFVAMWTAMMVPMMLPAIVPALRRSGASASRPCSYGTTAMAAAYFATWAAAGLALYPAGVAFAEIAMRDEGVSRLVPFAAGVVVLASGAIQLSAWKVRQLACCRNASPCGRVPMQRGSPWRDGVRLGIACVACCANLMAVLLVLGVMDLSAMAAVTAAVWAERLLPAPARVARATGIIASALGIWLLANACAAR